MHPFHIEDANAMKCFTVQKGSTTAATNGEDSKQQNQQTAKTTTSNKQHGKNSKNATALQFRFYYAYWLHTSMQKAVLTPQQHETEYY